MSFLERLRKAADPKAQQEDRHLLKRTAPAWSMFGGAEIIDAGAILRWETEYGTIGLVYSVPFDHHSRASVCPQTEREIRIAPAEGLRLPGVCGAHDGLVRT